MHYLPQITSPEDLDFKPLSTSLAMEDLENNELDITSGSDLCKNQECRFCQGTCDDLKKRAMLKEARWVEYWTGVVKYCLVTF